MAETCVICLEKDAQKNGRSCCSASRVFCKKGCRGADAVCGECYAEITRCVYCRRRIKLVLDENDRPAVGGVFAVTLIVGVFCWITSIYDRMGGDAYGNYTADHYESAFGVPIVFQQPP